MYLCMSQLKNRYPRLVPGNESYLLKYSKFLTFFSILIQVLRLNMSSSSFHIGQTGLWKMAEKVKVPNPGASFEYELFEGDADHLRTVVATPTQISPWIQATELKLKHRIGRGTFGDVWLAIHRQSADDFDECHEVAVKMLHPLKKDLAQAFVYKFERLFLKWREILGVGWLHGVSIMKGKICIAMKFYGGSVADRIALLKERKLQLPDVLRYGIDLANGTQELHSIGLPVLNLKPSNFLLNEHDQAVLGDFGIPYLLLEMLNSEKTLILGTPNYMAPEQWEPEVRGPISFETDSWGFGCSILEMLTGVRPWFGKSIEEIYQSVVIKQEKPRVPSGLPPDVENVINGCFEYDLRNRPLMEDILSVFQRSLNVVNRDGAWTHLKSRGPTKNSTFGGYTAWYLSKDHLQVGDTVRPRKPLNSCKPQNKDVPKGIVIGLDGDTDRNRIVLVKISGLQNPLSVQESKLERVTSGFAVGDWVRLNDKQSKHSPVGILHSVQRDGYMAAAFVGLKTLWMDSCSELQMAKGYCVGQFVRLKVNVRSPRFEWPRKIGGEWSTGRISQILPNGCLIVGFPGRFVFGDESNNFLADPAEVELVSFDSCPGMMEKYYHLEDFHWAVRPLVIALGLFTAMKLTISVGRGASAKLRKGRTSGDGQGGGNTALLHPPVANILFKEGAPTAKIYNY